MTTPKGQIKLRIQRMPSNSGVADTGKKGIQ